MFLFHVFKAASLSLGCEVPALLRGNVNTIKYVEVIWCRCLHTCWFLRWPTSLEETLSSSFYEIPLLLCECLDGISISINKCHKWFAWVWLEEWTTPGMIRKCYPCHFCLTGFMCTHLPTDTHTCTGSSILPLLPEEVGGMLITG